MLQEEFFDGRLAGECAKAFSGSTGIGCTVSLKDGKAITEYGYGCRSCRICTLADLPAEKCTQAHIYGMTEAERFGGKYIYYCPMGLTCFVSPILGSEGSAAKITVGPFLMVERDDYIACDLEESLGLKPERIQVVSEELQKVPEVDTEKVTSLSTLLFLAVGFMNNVSEANRMLEMQDSEAIQGQMTSYIVQLKGESKVQPYPFDTEKALISAIMQGNKEEAHRLLNEIFGHVFFVAAGDFNQAKARIYELFVMISRSAVDAGADPAQTLRLNQNYIAELPTINTIDTLCFWVTKTTNKFMDSVFTFMGAKHANIIHNTVQYLKNHCEEKISLEEMAERMYLSPAYFSRIFKRETGENFNSYLNHLRIEKSKKLLFHRDLKLADIALLSGFEDQSYFTKVFKRVTGSSPLKYRESNTKHSLKTY